MSENNNRKTLTFLVAEKTRLEKTEIMGALKARTVPISFVAAAHGEAITARIDVAKYTIQELTDLLEKFIEIDIYYYNNQPHFAIMQ